VNAAATDPISVPPARTLCDHQMTADPLALEKDCSLQNKNAFTYAALAFYH
jgi:hypothetical protein